MRNSSCGEAARERGARRDEVVDLVLLVVLLLRVPVRGLVVVVPVSSDVRTVSMHAGVREQTRGQRYSHQAFDRVRVG